jgi:DNA-binding IclR family transcriptional regulator
MRLLASERRGLGVSEIARRAGLVSSTCFHVLRTLVDEGFVTFDPERKTYRTGVGLLALVREAMASNDFAKVVQSHLDRLAATYNLTAVAVELDNRERMVIVALSRGGSTISLHVNIGTRFPSFISATGRCVAAESGLSRSELKERFQSLRWDKAPRFEDWYAEVERTKSEKTGIDRGSFLRGITVLSTLVPKTPDRITRGIALIGLDHQMTEKMVRQLREDLLETACDVRTRLN